MKRISLFVLLACISLVPAHMQQVGVPLTLQVNGDYWAWGTSGLQQRTNWGHNQDPIISPNGQQIAYKATAQLAVDARKGSTSAVPVNIWLLDVATGAPTKINDQPADASFGASDKPDKFVIRSAPTWSPDSKTLAWTELAVDKGSAAIPDQQLVIFDLAQKTQKVIAPDLPSQPDVMTTNKVQWGDLGIAVWTVSGTTDASGNFKTQDAILLYNPEGKRLLTVKIASLYEFAWLKDGQKDYIAILAQGPENAPLSEPQWLLIDPTNGQIAGMPGVPEMYSLQAPSGLGIYPAAMGTSPDWQITDQGKIGSVDDVYAFSHVLGISSDGQQLAYVKQGAAYVYNNGKTTKVAPSDVYALSWGPVGWRIHRKGLGQ